MNDEEFQKRLEELIEDRRSGASELVRLGLGIAAKCAQCAESKKTIELQHYLAERDVLYLLREFQAMPAGRAARAGGNEPSGTGDASMARRQGQQYLL
jgi:hypothetical protein